MYRATEFITTDKKFPQVQARILHHHDYWDGPRNGVCFVEGGNEHWFDILVHWDDENTWPRDEHGDRDYCFELPWFKRFLVWKISDEEMSYWLKKSNDFKTALSFGMDSHELKNFYRRYPPD